MGRVSAVAAVPIAVDVPSDIGVSNVSGVPAIARIPDVADVGPPVAVILSAIRVVSVITNPRYYA